MLQRHTMQLQTFPGKGSSWCTYLELKQWAAVTTHSLARTAPPQMCSSEICTLTCQGHEYGTATSPPIILLKMNLGWFEGTPQIPSETESADVSRSLQRLRFGEAKNSQFKSYPTTSKDYSLPFFAKSFNFPHYKGSKCLDIAWGDDLSKNRASPRWKQLPAFKVLASNLQWIWTHPILHKVLEGKREVLKCWLLFSTTL